METEHSTRSTSDRQAGFKRSSCSCHRRSVKTPGWVFVRFLEVERPRFLGDVLILQPDSRA